jgi:hypothetical protein
MDQNHPTTRIFSLPSDFHEWQDERHFVESQKESYKISEPTAEFQSFAHLTGLQKLNQARDDDFLLKFELCCGTM